MGTIWGVYVRISQARNGETDGVERHEAEIRALVERMGDGEIAGIYRDNDASGYSRRKVRKAFERMLTDARAGSITGIAAWDPDRLSRDPDRDNIRLIDLTEHYSIKLATVTGDVDLTTSSGRMAFRIAGAIARRESEHKAERLMSKHDSKAAKGEAHGGGYRSFGFKPNGIDHDEDEARLIRDAARRVLGGESLGAIVREWREAGVITTVRERNVYDADGNVVDRVPFRKPFHSTSLRRLLTNARIAGLRVHRGEVVGDGDWTEIISKSDYQRLCELFEGRKSTFQHAGPGRKYSYSGVLVCGRCAGRMTGSSGGYRCEHCKRNWVPAGPLEAILDRAVLGYVTSETFRSRLNLKLAEVQGDPTDRAKLEEMRGELADYQRLPERFQTEATRARTVTLSDAVEAAKRRLAAVPNLSLLADLPSTRATLEAAWSVWTTEQRRARIAAVIESITIRPASKRGEAFDPSRIEPPRWR
jgi:site-specific DNA recombinase